MNRSDDGDRAKRLEEENEALGRENQLLKTILDKVHESVLAVNERDEFILYNREAEKLEGFNREDILGKKEDEVYPQPFYFSDEVTKMILKTGIPVTEQPYWFRSKDGRKTNMIFSAYPFFDQGKIAAVFVIFRNMNQMGDFIATTLNIHKQFFDQDQKLSLENGYHLEDIISVNQKIQEIIAEARKIAVHNSHVLIVGETGTGKELFAHGIHNAALHSGEPFIPINCAAIPDTLLESLLFGTVKGAFSGATDMPGLFEQAADGTVYLDEINSMSLPLQSKLLRVLQEKTVRRLGSEKQTALNCRIISSSNTDPLEAIENQTFRPDLYFRLATVTINIPPLRERKEDIGILAIHFIQHYNQEFGLLINQISDDLLQQFYQYDWPGNIRELKNFIENGMNFVQAEDKVLNISHLSESFQERLGQSDHLPEAPVHQGTLKSTLLETEKNLIKTSLVQHQGNITKTALSLGISRQYLHQKIRTYHLAGLKG